MRRPPEFGIEVAGPASRLANPADWPATYIFRLPGTPGCTATAVAERVILTAAHCLGGEVSGRLVVDQQSLTLTCEKHPQWPQTASADFALCLLGAPLQRPPAGFETLVLDAAPVRGTQITLLGFGCRRDGSAGFGLLAEGLANTIDVTDEVIQTGTAATLCTGDSGGGAYLGAGANRRIAALNHAGNQDGSLLNRIDSPQFRSWARQWSSSHGQAICGLDKTANGCRL